MVVAICVLLLVCFSLVGAVYFYKLTHGSTALRTGFKAKIFLTSNEVEFYHRLQKACENRLVIMAQVSLGALVDTKLDKDHSRYWETRAAFSSKIIDYVLCDPISLKPLILIELDDNMHDFDKDRIRDSFTAFAGFKTLRFWSKNKPQSEALRAEILKALGTLAAK